MRCVDHYCRAAHCEAKIHCLPRAGGPAGTSFNLTHSYDPAGNRTLLDDGTTLTTYTYSPANRLTLANAAGVLTTYGYDAAGNRTSQELPTDATYYAWDAADRMASAKPAVGLTSFTYDADGRRILKDAPGGPTGYLFDFKRLLHETDDVSGDITNTYTYTSSTQEEFGDLIGEENEPYFHQFDAMANTNALLDESGAVEATYKYYAFGNVASVSVGSDYWDSLSVDQWSNMTVDQWWGLPLALTSNMLSGGKKQYYLDPETQL